MAISGHESTKKSLEDEVFVVPALESKAESQLASEDAAADGIDERKLMRKIDWHLIPWLALLYLLNFLDRGSIGNAKARCFI